MRHAQLGRKPHKTLALQTPLDATYAVPQQASSAWPVLVCRLQLAVGWRTGFEALQRVHYASFAVVQQQFIEPVLCYVSSSLDPAHHGAARTDRESQLRFMLVA